MACSFSWKGKDGYFPLQHGLDRAPLDDFCAEEKGKCMAASFLRVFFCSTKQKTNARCSLTKVDKWRQRDQNGQGKSFEEIFCCLFSCVAFPWYVSWQGFRSNPNEKWIALQQNPKFSICNLPLIFSNCLIWSSSMVQLVPNILHIMNYLLGQSVIFLLVSTANKKPQGKSRLQAKTHIFKLFQSRMAEPASPLGNNALLSTTTANPDNSTLRTCQVRSKIDWAVKHFDFKSKSSSDSYFLSTL